MSKDELKFIALVAAVKEKMLESNLNMLTTKRTNVSLKLQQPVQPLRKRSMKNLFGGVMVLMVRINSPCSVLTNQVSASSNNQSRNLKLRIMESRKITTVITTLTVAILRHRRWVQSSK